MSRHQSPEEVEQENLNTFGPVLGPLYHELSEELTWLNAKWLEFRKLYARSEERIELLNGTADFFFGVIQRVLWDDVLLHIARMTDPQEHGKNKNLTLRALPDAVPDPDLAAELRVLVATALSCSEFAREWRNKHLAHRDLSHALDVKATPLPGVSRQQIREVLDSFGKILNCLLRAYRDEELMYREFLTHSDADALAHYLVLAVRAEELQRERVLQGKELPEDLEPPRNI